MGVAEDVHGGDVDHAPCLGGDGRVQDALRRTQVGVEHSWLLVHGDAHAIFTGGVDDAVGAAHEVGHRGGVRQVALHQGDVRLLEERGLVGVAHQRDDVHATGCEPVDQGAADEPGAAGELRRAWCGARWGGQQSGDGYQIEEGSESTDSSQCFTSLMNLPACAPSVAR